MLNIPKNTKYSTKNTQTYNTSTLLRGGKNIPMSSQNVTEPSSMMCATDRYTQTSNFFNFCCEKKVKKSKTHISGLIIIEHLVLFKGKHSEFKRCQ
jgi:hypothetical protein